MPRSSSGMPQVSCTPHTRHPRFKVLTWQIQDLEAAAEAAGLPMAICRTEESWAAHPHGAVMAKLPWVPMQRLARIGRSAAAANGDSFPAPSSVAWCRQQPVPPRPLSGLKVLCVTHAIAGPSTGRTLAEHGASVLQVMFTHGFEHSFVYTYANLGTASTRLNLHKDADRQRLRKLVQDAHVWVDSHRPGAISNFGFGDENLQNLNPGLIICRVRCYGTTGPWASKPGFDMQGSASSGMMYVMDKGDGRPQWPPGMVINDYTTGYSGALAIQSILLKRLRGDIDAHDGWLVSPSLTGTAMGIMRRFRTKNTGKGKEGDEPGSTALPPEVLQGATPMGYLKTLAPLPKMSLTPIYYEEELLVPIGSSRPSFPGYDDGYDLNGVEPLEKKAVLGNIAVRSTQRIETMAAMGASSRSKLIV